MSLKDRHNELLAELSNIYLPHRFNLDKRNSKFYRKECSVFWVVTRKYSTHYYYNPKFSINVEKIEKILNKIYPEAKNITLWKGEGRPLALDMNCSDYDYLYDNEGDYNRPIMHEVSESSDLKKIVNDHAEYMEKVGFPFFKQMETMEGVSKFINNRIIDVEEDLLYSTKYRKAIDKFFDRREVLSGYVSAYLSEESKLDKLVTRYKELFKHRKYLLDGLEEVIKYFDDNNC